MNPYSFYKSVKGISQIVAYKNDDISIKIPQVIDNLPNDFLRNNRQGSGSISVRVRSAIDQRSYEPQLEVIGRMGYVLY